jgi:hypothetical protein
MIQNLLRWFEITEPRAICYSPFTANQNTQQVRQTARSPYHMANISKRYPVKNNSCTRYEMAQQSSFSIQKQITTLAVKLSHFYLFCQSLLHISSIKRNFKAILQKYLCFLFPTSSYYIVSTFNISFINKINYVYIYFKIYIFLASGIVFLGHFL